MNNKLLPIFASILVIFCSCQKEGNSDSKKELLTRNSWVIEKAEEKDGANSWVDTFPYWQACKKDDKWIFRSNFSMELNEAANACSGQVPNQILDIVTWAFAQNETKIRIEDVTFLIETLDENKLIISTSELSGGIQYQTKITFGH